MNIRERFLDWYWFTYRPWWRTTVLDDAYAYFLNASCDKLHVVRLRRLKRGQYYEIEERMFEAVFQLLIDYVEEELAFTMKGAIDTTDSACVEWKHASWWHRWYHRAMWNERLGLSHLDWAAELDAIDTPERQTLNGQAEHARQVRALYMWYKYERPKRVDPYDAVQDGALSDAAHEAFLKTEEYHDEDTQKMQEVVALRRGMWT